MRLVTKAMLILALIVICVTILAFTGKQAGRTDANDGFRPRAKPAEDSAKPYNDPLSPLERWRNRLKELAEKQPADAAPTKPADGPAAPASAGRNPAEFYTSAVNEGVAAVLPRKEVAGADPPGPPGPFLKPEGLKGEVVTQPPRPTAEAVQDTGRTHVIADGDTLYEIAIHYYGDARYVSLIQDANPGIDPRALRVGQRIRVPEKDAPQAEQAAPETPAPKAMRIYVVRRNDSLISIALRFYGDAAMYKKIYEANSDILSSPSATLYVGQRLRLPEGR